MVRNIICSHGNGNTRMQGWIYLYINMYKIERGNETKMKEHEKCFIHVRLRGDVMWAWKIINWTDRQLIQREIFFHLHHLFVFFFWAINVTFFFCSFLGRFIFSSYLCVMFRSHRCFQSYPSAFSSLTLLPGIRIRRMCDGSPRKKIGDRRKVERHEIWLFRCVDFVSLVWAYNFCCVIIKWIFVACCVASSLLFSLAAFPEPTKKGLMFLTKLCINQSFVDLNDGGKKSP